MKNILKATMIAAFAAIASYGIYTNQKVDTMSDIMLANLEALADDEIKPGDPCYSNAKYDADKPKAVKCGIPCTYEPLNIPWFESTSYCS